MSNLLASAVESLFSDSRADVLTRARCVRTWTWAKGYFMTVALVLGGLSLTWGKRNGWVDFVHGFLPLAVVWLALWTRVRANNAYRRYLEDNGFPPWTPSDVCEFEPLNKTP